MPNQSGLFIVDDQDHVISMFLSESDILVDDSNPRDVKFHSDTNMTVFDVHDTCTLDTLEFTNCISKSPSNTKTFRGTAIYVYKLSQPEAIKFDLFGGSITMVSPQEVALTVGVEVPQAVAVASPQPAVVEAEPYPDSMSSADQKGTIALPQQQQSLNKGTIAYPQEQPSPDYKGTIALPPPPSYPPSMENTTQPLTQASTQSSTQQIILTAFEEGFKIGEMIKQ
jgi:hypothetical protein